MATTHSSKISAKIFLFLFFFLSAFLATSSAILTIVEHYHLGADYLLENKTIHIQEAPSKYDVVFAGSSYMYRNIKPKVFTSVLGSLSHVPPAEPEA